MRSNRSLNESPINYVSREGAQDCAGRDYRERQRHTEKSFGFALWHNDIFDAPSPNFVPVDAARFIAQTALMKEFLASF